MIITILDENFEQSWTDKAIDKLKALFCKHVYVSMHQPYIYREKKYVRVRCVKCGCETILDMSNKREMKKLRGDI